MDKVYCKTTWWENKAKKSQKLYKFAYLDVFIEMQAAFDSIERNCETEKEDKEK